MVTLVIIYLSIFIFDSVYGNRCANLKKHRDVSEMIPVNESDCFIFHKLRIGFEFYNEHNGDFKFDEASEYCKQYDGGHLPILSNVELLNSFEDEIKKFSGMDSSARIFLGINSTIVSNKLFSNCETRFRK
jgi:hypothetical protein